MSLLTMNPHHTKIIPVIADPVGHATSPFMFNKVFDTYEFNAIVLPIRVPKGELPNFFKALKYLNCPGFIISMPHKQDIIPLLDKIDDISVTFNSISAVHIHEDGTMEGRGFDGKSAVAAIIEGFNLEDKEVMMIGAGGVSGVIGAELANKGVKKLNILNRTLRKAKKVADVLMEKTPMEVTYTEFTSNNAKKAAQTADAFVQATCLGMLGIEQDYENLDFMDFLKKDACVFEVISNPPETSVVKKAHSLNLKTFIGMDMQANGVPLYIEFITGTVVPKEAKEIARELYCKLFNYTIKIN